MTEWLAPNFEKAHWRSRRHLRFREVEAFSKKKGHYEPEEHNSFAGRWAAELTLPEAKEEIRQVYENAVSQLGEKRSKMEKSERELDTPAFRYLLDAEQDSGDPRLILLTRTLWVKSELRALPPLFDTIFPIGFDEIVVPFSGGATHKEILVILEEWESTLNGKLEENDEQLRLRLPSGFLLAVDFEARETSFAKAGVEGALLLASAVAAELKTLKFQRPF